MPDLLFLTQRLPYPPIKGEKIRPLQILKYLDQWYDVHLGCLDRRPVRCAACRYDSLRYAGKSMSRR